MRRLIILIFIGVVSLVSACSDLRQIMPNANPAADRKEKSEKLLKSLGIAVNPSLPLVESESQTKFRSPQDTARRALVLCALVLTANKVAGGAAWVKQERLWDAVNPKEKAFFENPKPAEKDRVNAARRAEALFVLLSAMGKIDNLDIPTQVCDEDVVQNTLPNLVDPFGNSSSTQSSDHRQRSLTQRI